MTYEYCLLKEPSISSQLIHSQRKDFDSARSQMKVDLHALVHLQCFNIIVYEPHCTQLFLITYRLLFLFEI